MVTADERTMRVLLLFCATTAITAAIVIASR